jgi:predicted secreted protein
MAKYAAKGTVLAYESATGPSVWSTIPCVGDFDLALVPVKESIDVTNHDSGSFAESISGIGTQTTISVPIVAWDGASTHHAAMVTRSAADTLTNFKVTLKDTKVVTFAAYIKGINVSNPVRGALSATLEIEATGTITVT